MLNITVGKRVIVREARTVEGWQAHLTSASAIREVGVTDVEAIGKLVITVASDLTRRDQANIVYENG